MLTIWDVCSTLSISNYQSLDIDFLGKGNLWLDYTYQPEEIHLAQTILYEALAKTAPGQLAIWGYDRDLSGVFASFASLSSGDSKLLELISSDQDFMIHLDYIKQQIQTVQNTIKGRRDSLLEFREFLRAADESPVEGYKLVALFLDMEELDDSLRKQILRLVRVGPRFGVSFFIVSPAISHLVQDRDLLHMTVIRLNGSKVSVKDGPAAQCQFVDPNEIIRFCEASDQGKEKAPEVPTVDFRALHRDVPQWTSHSNSIEGLTFSIGKSGVDNMEITIGDEKNQRHNAVITGAVGQGKSNLISVIIHSLCWRYPPSELQLYLIDFKEGVTFKPFSNISQEEYLPHAVALGLESDAGFCLAVLESLHKEYLRRMSLLKIYNMKSVRELRAAHPEIVIPRIVTIIDEFQMMFGDDIQSGSKAAELLERSVRLFRAAGIHFILASQTLSGNLALSQRKDSIFGQVPIRIALKNSIAESQQTLAINNPAAAFLQTREAVVNLDYGEPSQNRKTMVAFADENELSKVRRSWWEKTRSQYRPPYVFDSARRTTPANNMEILRNLREKAGIPSAVIGTRVSVEDAPLLLPLATDPGYNIAIIGMPDQDCNQAVGMMQSIAISLAIQHPEGDARFIFCDFGGNDKPSGILSAEFSAIMEGIGYSVESLSPEDFESEIGHLNDQDEPGEFVYLFGAAMDRWRFMSDPVLEPPLKAFVNVWPSKKVHLIGWWIKASSFTTQVAGFGNSDAFNSKVFLRIDERAVQSLTSPFVKWSAQQNRALISDSVQFADEITFIPHSPVSQDDVRLFEEQIWE